MEQTKGKQGWRGDSEGHRRAGRKGGKATVKKLGVEHLREIGRRGGKTVSADREHMAEIGRIGGQVSRSKRER